jgi:protein-S-isoprenylcysteine O-methyltransferase Ste14
MMLGLILAFWATPEMSATRFVLAALLTLYIFVGIRFEERSLLQEFGETYRTYQQKIGMFFTLGN